MKTFKEFIAEDKMGERLGKMSDADFEQFLKGRTPEEAKTYRAKRSTFRTSGAAGQGVQDAARQAQQRTAQPSGQQRTQPRTAQPSTPKQPGRLQRIGTGVARQGAYVGADIAADVAIDQIKNPKTRENVRTAKDFGLGAAALYTNPITSIALGGAGQSSSAPAGIRDVGAYRIQKRIDPSAGEAGFDKFLATGKDKKGYTYNDPNAEKIMAYRRDRVGSKNPEDKPFRVGAAKVGGQVVPVEWGSVAGEKKVGTPADVQAVKARPKSAGSALVGTGQKPKKPVTLPKTQLVRDPKTGQQRVGDLAYKGGKPVYVPRASVADRNPSLMSRLSRATGIGGQRERDAAAAKSEYRTALKSTQQYYRDIGVKKPGSVVLKPTGNLPARALPGYGVGPKKVGPKIVGPKKVGTK